MPLLLLFLARSEKYCAAWELVVHSEWILNE